MSFAVLIPSKNAINISACIKAVWAHERHCRVIVIDDGIDWNKTDFRIYGGLEIVDGVKPFVYSRNINLGIKTACHVDSYILLNDDALLQTPGGFTSMAEAAIANPNYGIISATTNVSGSLEQRPQGVGLRPASSWLPFVCVLIPHSTVETVGLLDEAFVDYGYDDNDYCHRTRLAGLDFGIHDRCYVDHGSLSSSYRGKSKLNPKKTNEGLFKKKWSLR